MLALQQANLFSKETSQPLKTIFFPQKTLQVSSHVDPQGTEEFMLMNSPFGQIFTLSSAENISMKTMAVQF